MGLGIMRRHYVGSSFSRKYLYNNGVSLISFSFLCKDAEYNFSPSSQNGMEMRVDAGGFFTLVSEMMDMSEYSKLYIEMNIEAANMESQNSCTFGLKNSQNNSDEWYDWASYGESPSKEVWYNQSSPTGDKTFSMDISRVSNRGNVCMAFHGYAKESSGQFKATIKSIYLTK